MVLDGILERNHLLQDLTDWFIKAIDFNPLRTLLDRPKKLYELNWPLPKRILTTWFDRQILNS